MSILLNPYLNTALSIYPRPHQVLLLLLSLSKYHTVQGLKTIYPAECNPPASWSAASFTPAISPQRHSSDCFGHKQKKITKFSKILLTQNPLYLHLAPIFVAHKILFSHFISIVINWRSEDGRLDSSPEVLSPAVINLNR